MRLKTGCGAGSAHHPSLGARFGREQGPPISLFNAEPCTDFNYASVVAGAEQLLGVAGLLLISFGRLAGLRKRFASWHRTDEAERPKASVRYAGGAAEETGQPDAQQRATG